MALGVNAEPFQFPSKNQQPSILNQFIKINYQQSTLQTPQEQAVFFNAGSADDPNVCTPTTLGAMLPKGFSESMEALSDNYCQSSAKEGEVKYCECINDKKNYVIKGKTDKEKIDYIKKVKDELYNSKLTELVNSALFSYIRSSEIIGYGAISNPELRKNLGNKHCAPGQFENRLKDISSKSPKHKACLDRVNDPKYFNLLSERLEASRRGNYSNLKIGVSSGVKTLSDISFMTDSLISDEFKADVYKMYKMPSIYKDFDLTNISSLDGRIDFIEKKELDKIKSIYTMHQKVQNGEVVSDDLYREVQQVYLTNPLVRRIFRNIGFENENGLTVKVRATLDKNVNITDKLYKLTDSDKDALALIGSKLAKRIIGKGDPNISLEEFLERGKAAHTKSIEGLNNICVESFKQIESFCDNQTSDEEMLAFTPTQLVNFIDELKITTNNSDETNPQTSQIINGAFYCHYISCVSKSGKASDKCAAQSANNVAAMKEIDVTKEMSDGTFNKSVAGYRKNSSDRVVDAEINFGDAHSIENSISGTSSGALGSDNFVGNVNAAGDEPIIDTSIDASFVNNGSNFGSDGYNINPVGSIYNSNSAPETVSPSSLSSIDAQAIDSAIASEVSPSDTAGNNANPSPSPSETKANEELKKQLESIKKELAISKDERENTRKELEDFKTQKVIEDQQRAMAEKEKNMRDNLAGLEEKIRKLENEKANISQQLPTKFSNPRVSSDSFASGQSFDTNTASDFSNQAAAGSSRSSSSSLGGGQKFSISNSAGGKLAFTGTRGAGITSNVGQSVISLSSKDDPSLGAKVREAYKNGVETLYVTIGGNYYRVTPKKDISGNLVVENGEVALNFEITTTEIAQNATANKLPEGLLRAPAAVDDEAVIAPSAGEEALRYSDLLSKLREAK